MYLEAAWNIAKGGVERLQELEDQKNVCCEIVSHKNNREASPMISQQIWLPKQGKHK